MASIAIIRAQMERRLPGGLSICERPAPEIFATGILNIDQGMRGVPQSALTQICIAEGMSSGKTTMLVSLMAQLTHREHFCALVDASDCFDPVTAEAAGVDLERVLWVRCGEKKQGLKPLEQAFKATDILVQNGGFGLIAVDLSKMEERQIRKVPLTTWFRFARVVEKMPTALVFLTTYPAAQSCAGLTLHMAGGEPNWTGPKHLSHAQSLIEMKCEVEVGRARLRKPVQSVQQKFAASPVWA
jgi:recombination protein RecA